MNEVELPITLGSRPRKRDTNLVRIRELQPNLLERRSFESCHFFLGDWRVPERLDHRDHLLTRNIGGLTGRHLRNESQQSGLEHAPGVTFYACSKSGLNDSSE